MSTDAKRGVAEPDGVVFLHHHVVRRVEALAIVFVTDDGDGAVVLGAGDTPGAAVLGGDQPPLIVTGVPVREVRGLAEDR